MFYLHKCDNIFFGGSRDHKLRFCTLLSKTFLKISFYRYKGSPFALASHIEPYCALEKSHLP